VKVKRDRQNLGGRDFEAASAEDFVMQRPRQATGLRQHPWLADQIGKRQISPLRPTALRAGGDHRRVIEQRLRNQVRFGHRGGNPPEYHLGFSIEQIIVLLNRDVFVQHVKRRAGEILRKPFDDGWKQTGIPTATLPQVRSGQLKAFAVAAKSGLAARFLQSMRLGCRDFTRHCGSAYGHRRARRRLPG
jgi:hypothetical protein